MLAGGREPTAHCEGRAHCLLPISSPDLQVTMGGAALLKAQHRLLGLTQGGILSEGSTVLPTDFEFDVEGWQKVGHPYKPVRHSLPSRYSRLLDSNCPDKATKCSRLQECVCALSVQ